MAIEIERKYLVTNDRWRGGSPGIRYRQGYLCTDPERTVRVRIAGEKALLTIKGRSQGIRRSEFEYEIPLADAGVLLDQICQQPLIEKIRYHVDVQGVEWTIDEFEGDNAGLVLAEVELEHDAQTVTLPPWVGAEVSHDSRYFNASLINHPYSRWSSESNR